MFDTFAHVLYCAHVRQSQAWLKAVYRWGIRYLYDNFRLILDFRTLAPLLQPRLAEMAAAAQLRGSRLLRLVGFLDGTFRRTPFPRAFEQLFYNSHYHAHGFKFQGLQFVCGLFALDGPCRGAQHDLTLYALADTEAIVRDHFGCGEGRSYYLYADGAYKCTQWMQAPYVKPRLSPLLADEKAWNKDMSSTRIVVEWLFKDLTATFAHLDNVRAAKLLKNEPCMEYAVAAILRQMMTCARGESPCTMYFGCAPPPLADLMGVLGDRALVLPDASAL